MDPLTGFTPGAAPSATRSDADGTAQTGNSALSSDFETFLRMLTTHLQSQDPLNPVESDDFAVQLATFSSVEQQVKTNELLTGLGAQLDTLGMAQFPSWIGLEAEVRAAVQFSGEPVEVEVSVDPDADAAELVVTNAQGTVVTRSALPAESGTVLWDGADRQGQALPEGRYTLTVLSLLADDTIASHDVHMRGRVSETRLDGGDVRIVLQTGQSAIPDEVIGLRPPQA